MKSLLFVKPSHWLTTLVAAGAALVAGATATYSILKSQPMHQTAPSAVEFSNKVASVAARGYLEPQGEVIKVSAPAFMEGARVDQLLVQRGDRVQAGQAIAILDSYGRLQAALTQAKAQVKVSESRLAQVKAGAKQGDIVAQDARFVRTKAELEGQVASQRANIASLEAQRQGEQAAQQATIERLRAELVNAQNDCRRYQTLYADGAVSEQDRDRFCLQAKTGEKSLKEAEANLRRIITTMDENINEAKANLKRTVLTLDQQIKENQATLQAVAEVRPVDVQVAEAELASSQGALQRAEAELALASVRSPKSGQILKIHTWPGELISSDGIVELGQTAQMYVRAEVYETDISRVKLGQGARIKTNSAIGDLAGTVDEIGLQIGRQDVLGTDPVADADARVVEVKIRLDPPSSEKVARLTNLEVNVVIDAPAQ